MDTKITGALVGAIAGAVLLAWGSLSAQALPAAAVQADNGGMITLVEARLRRGPVAGPGRPLPLGPGRENRGSAED